jgi:G3E family GTPase
VEHPLPDHDAAIPEDFAAATPHVLPLTAVTLPLPPGLDWAVLSLWVSALLQARGDQILRMKAVVPSPGGRMLLQTVRQTIQTPEILPGTADATGDGQLVLLGHDLPTDALARSLSVFARIANQRLGHQEF